VRVLVLLCSAVVIAGCRSKDDGWTVDSGFVSSLEDDTGSGAAHLDDTASPVDTGPQDGDGDGFDSSTDCDDADPSVNPDANEVCNGLDDDCNGAVDDSVGDLWYADDDADGFGDASASTTSCDEASGWVADASDCDDANSSIHPDADELCNGYDDDCDLLIDADDDSVVDATIWYLDADGDGVGDAHTAVLACEAPESFVADGGDCDDGDDSVYLGAAEVCDALDNDCDGLIDDEDDTVSGQSTWWIDADADGHGDAATAVSACEEPTGYAGTDDDCDDADATVFLGANEVCDELDNDCDGDVDEAAADAGRWYLDSDGDGFGDEHDWVDSCAGATGYVADATDCDDLDAEVNPGEDEVCNGVDDDCDGLAEEADDSLVDAGTWYADADSDGFGDASTGVHACEAPSGHVDDDADCDDTDSAVNPEADEVCNGLDDDCNTLIDDADPGITGTTTWFVDTDADGFGDASVSTDSCEAPSGYVADATDCNDTSASASPAGSEVCDGLDNDCDGEVDVGASDAATWYADSDGDGYGDAGASAADCDGLTGYVADATDCDDTAADVNPGADEVCNDLDDDCDALVDDDDASLADASTWYADTDADGYGDASSSSEACDAPSGLVADATDCDDGDGDVYPSADEHCNDADDDCDSLVDEDATDLGTWFVDNDGDGFGDATDSSEACDAPSGSVADASDCDDADSEVHPDADEVCNGVDDDCDGTVDVDASDPSTFYADADSDGFGDASSAVEACDAPSGYGADATDCDDADGAVFPGAAESCNSGDDDCDAAVDEDADDASTWYVDGDSDGYGDASAGSEACAQPSGSVADASDCDDAAGSVYPGAAESCNGTDDDCDSTVDEDAVDPDTWYADSDADGFGDPSADWDGCEQATGYVEDARDCDDGDASVHPSAEESCDGVDNDCDGDVDDDDDDVVDPETWWADADLDGYGDASDSTEACSEPSGYVGDDTDCDDDAVDVNPAASESCDGVDEDCDDAVDEGGVCPCTTVSYDVSTYMLCTSAANWSTAQSTCASYGYHLFTIDSYDEQDFVEGEMDALSTGKWWMGFTDAASEGTWVWEDGSSVSYTDWYSGEPNDSGGNEDCGQLNRFHPDYGWNDEPCSSSFAYICEAD